MSGEPYTGLPWYRESDAKVAQAVLSTALYIYDSDNLRLGGYDVYLRMYGGSRTSAYGPMQSLRGHPSRSTASALTGDQIERLLSGGKSPLRMNLGKSAVDTLSARVGQIKPRTTFLTTRGDWSLQRKAKYLQMFVDGVYHQSDAYIVAGDVFRDSMVLGTGVMTPYVTGAGTKNPRFGLERSPAWEWFVESGDGEYGKPACLYRIRWVSREKIRRAGWDKAVDAGRQNKDSADDMARVVEAWFRPEHADNEPTEDAFKLKDVYKRGRHVLCVEDTTIVDEFYPWDEFPAVFFHWNRPVSGFWCDTPALKEVMGIQIEINKLLAKVQRSMTKVGQPMVFIPSSANMAESEFSNEEAKMWKYDGSTAPSVTSFQPVSPQILSHLWELWRKGFEILGLSELQASAQAPAGMESARGLERLSEQSVLRFKKISEDWQFALAEDLTRRFIRLAKATDSDTPGGLKIRSPGSKRSFVIVWKDVAIDEDGALMQTFNTTTLPTEPAARIQEVERLQNAGFVQQDTAMALLDMPDVQSETDFVTADRDNLMWQLEQMLEDGVAVTPDPYQDLTRAVAMTQNAVLRAQSEGCPEKNIVLARNFTEMCKAMLQPPEEPVDPNAVPADPSAIPAPAPGMDPVAAAMGGAAPTPLPAQGALPAPM